MTAKRLLVVNACVTEHIPSRTKRLCDSYLEAYRGRWEIDEIILEKAGLYPFTDSMLRHRSRCIAENDFSSPEFDLAHRVAAADRIVVAAPHWDLSFPSLLKVFIEHIMVSGLTFHYVDNQAEGLCHADKLVYITTAGGYLPKPDWAFGYVESIAHMLGIFTVEMMAAEGLDIEGADVEKIMKAAEEKM